MFRSLILAAVLLAAGPLVANAGEITLLPSVKLQIGDRDNYGNYWDGGSWRDRDYWRRHYEWRDNRWHRHDNGWHKGWYKGRDKAGSAAIVLAGTTAMTTAAAGDAAGWARSRSWTWPSLTNEKGAHRLPFTLFSIRNQLIHPEQRPHY
nr:Protein of uncharacterised function (DUF2502) [Klebsiella pneumoniae]